MARNNNQLLVPGAQNAMEQMKEEIANEFGVQTGADTTARENGSVGGEMVKRMIQQAEATMRNGNK
ncbi:small acid-soluble spore protein D (minor alpha/beta-type SASP) [Oceanobacillus limi]|uniref:Small acid-soluble spore protein D (Minor alpha/beta-type SASP) n=1 Tax=Oceanobacillus limi TaxID=930131 RepID=A0A1I0FLW5_9BACI|nr:alpha/beta-type small acid-soluble spore protein [Oceanobacillus limi]SET59303.1 small acid-soluble spore protein D (minor alpha/beta-type SASP) [Oceanobacillus limi]